MMTTVFVLSAAASWAMVGQICIVQLASPGPTVRVQERTRWYRCP